jgi:hypothetical protein
MKNPIKKFLKKILYSYPGYQAYNFLQKISGYRTEKKRVHKLIGYYPDLKNPGTFNEKVFWKKIYDRNPLLPVVSDKYEVRKYLESVLGKEEAEAISAKLIYITDKPETIPFEIFKDEYVLKPTHCSHRFALSEILNGKRNYTISNGGSKNTTENIEEFKKEILKICRRWLSNHYGFYKLEWAYQNIKRKIIIEKLLKDAAGNFPVDYKFNIFNGKCQLVQVYSDRFTGLKKEWYTPDWHFIDIRGINIGNYRKKPESFEYMKQIAERLGKPFDYIRVDLYLLGDKVYFGELTNYPNSGSVPFDPVELDREFGLKWKIIRNYWKLSPPEM